MTLSRTIPLSVFAAGLLVLAAPLRAADAWVLVLSENDRVIEVDRDSIIESDSGSKVAWARMRLPEAEAIAAGYAAVHALNRYDCINRSFLTVRRRYVDGRNLIVNEEDVIDAAPVEVTRSRVDDALWREVCRPYVQQVEDDITRLARDAERIASVLGERPASQPEPAAAVTPAAARSPAEVEPPVPVAAVPPPAARTSAVPSPDPAPSSAPAEPSSRPAAPAAMPLPVPPAGGAAQWDYVGARGPAHWGRMRPDWAACADGQRQSPIDIRDALQVDLQPVVFDYRPTYFRVTDTGRQLEVRVGEGLSAVIRGERYALVAIRLHRPGQEHVDGRSFDLSLDLVHRAADGRMAVVTLLAEAGGKPHPVLQTWLGNLPLEHGEHFVADAAVDLSALLPAGRAHYLYMGSLSIPPCTEGVLQVVMREPISVSWDQFRVLSSLHPPSARPLQANNARRIFASP